MRTAVRGVALALSLAVGSAAAGACGSSSVSPTARARGDARQACVDLLAMGSAIAGGHAVLSTTAKEGLAQAQVDATEAAALDGHWQTLEGTVRAIRSGLLLDQRTGLVATTDDLAVECQPLVVSSSTSAGG